MSALKDESDSFDLVDILTELKGLFQAESSDNLCGPIVFTLEDPQQLSFLKSTDTQLSLEPIKQTAAGIYSDLRMKAVYEYRLDQITLFMPIELEVIEPIVIEEKIEGDLIPDTPDDDQP